MIDTLRFAALIARPVDRVVLAGGRAVAPEVRDAASEGCIVPLATASLVAAILPLGGLTWAELEVPLRYSPAGSIRSLAETLAGGGLLTIDEHRVTLTSEGLRSTQAFVDLVPAAVESLWQVDADRIGRAHELARTVAQAALDSTTPFASMTANILHPKHTTPAYDLWRDLLAIRRHRADAHHKAWSEAGYTGTTIRELGAGKVRAMIEAQTNAHAGTIWEHLSPDDRVEFLSLIGGLDGIGVPS
jgi:hypothetical protein